MKIVVGLGNPGEKYKNSRHNVGFIKLNQLVKEKDLDWSYEKKFDADIARNENILYVKPQTHMNRSGEAVSKILKFYKLSFEDLMVVNDDVDLESGNFKVQFGKGSAGHKGVQNIIDHLGSNQFERIRVGIGRPKDPQTDTNNWVMGDLTAEELSEMQKIKLDIDNPIV